MGKTVLYTNCGKSVETCIVRGIITHNKHRHATLVTLEFSTTYYVLILLL